MVNGILFMRGMQIKRTHLKAQLQLSECEFSVLVFFLWTENPRTRGGKCRSFLPGLHCQKALSLHCAIHASIETF